MEGSGRNKPPMESRPPGRADPSQIALHQIPGRATKGVFAEVPGSGTGQSHRTETRARGPAFQELLTRPTTAVQSSSSGKEVATCDQGREITHLYLAFE